MQFGLAEQWNVTNRRRWRSVQSSWLLKNVDDWVNYYDSRVCNYYGRVKPTIFYYYYHFIPKKRLSYPIGRNIKGQCDVFFIVFFFFSFYRKHSDSGEISFLMLYTYFCCINETTIILFHFFFFPQLLQL